MPLLIITKLATSKQCTLYPMHTNTTNEPICILINVMVFSINHQTETNITLGCVEMITVHKQVYVHFWLLVFESNYKHAASTSAFT